MRNLRALLRVLRSSFALLSLLHQAEEFVQKMMSGSGYGEEERNNQREEETKRRKECKCCYQGKEQTLQ